MNKKYFKYHNIHGKTKKSSFTKKADACFLEARDKTWKEERKCQLIYQELTHILWTTSGANCYHQRTP